MATKKSTPKKVAPKKENLKKAYTHYSVHELYDDVEEGTNLIEDCETLEEADDIIKDLFEENPEGKYGIFQNIPIRIIERKISLIQMKL